MRRYERNQLYENSNGPGEIRCMHRCKLIKFDVVEKGNKLKGFTNRENIRETTENICLLKHGQSKICSHPNHNEKTCNIPRK